MRFHGGERKGIPGPLREDQSLRAMFPPESANKMVKYTATQQKSLTILVLHNWPPYITVHLLRSF